MAEAGWTDFRTAVARLPCTHQPVGVVCIPCQCMAAARDFLAAVVFYVADLEKYSHHGYARYGDFTLERVQATRAGLIQRWFGLSLEARTLVEEGQVQVADLSHGSHLTAVDPNLVYFHATHLYLDPVAEVSHRADVEPYHQQHVASKIQDDPDKNRNFATLYFEIHVEDRSSRPRQFDLRGSYAGRSGEHEQRYKFRAPSDHGFNRHVVPSTTSSEPARFEVFCDFHQRHNDSEVAILEDLTLKIKLAIGEHKIVHPAYSGFVTLFTDRATCHSCSVLIMQFQYLFGIDVRVIHGGVDDKKGYVT